MCKYRFRARPFAVAMTVVLFAIRAYGAETSPSPADFAVEKLRKAQVSDAFVLQLQQLHRPADRDKIIQLNVLGGLAAADYSGHYSKNALKRCAEFIRKNRRELRTVERQMGVSKEAIAALLWVETKHGKIVGRYNVANVFFSLIQADHPQVLQASLRAGEDKFPGKGDEYRQKIVQRSTIKANWALNELRALDLVFRNRPARLLMLSGSHSGAFGIPQFVPSSYVQWARTPSRSRKPDLFRISDVIQSVAFYLKANGWMSNDEQAQRAALFHYNRSQGYVDVILKIAGELKTNPRKKLAASRK